MRTIQKLYKLDVKEVKIIWIMKISLAKEIM